MKQFQNCLISIAMIGFTGCASYTPPVSGPTAVLDGAVSGVYRNANTCDYKDNFNLFSSDKIIISADRLVTVAVDRIAERSDPSWYCPSTISFYARANHSYYVQTKFTNLGLFKTPKCTIVVKDFTNVSIDQFRQMLSDTKLNTELDKLETVPSQVRVMKGNGCI